MNQLELITKLVGTSTLDLTVVIKDTAESKVTAKFIALTFENNGQVTMKLEISTTNKDVLLNTQGEISSMEPVITTKMLRADNNTQISVIDENGIPILDNENLPLTIPENVFWKYLAWDRSLFASFKDLVENAIKVKFNLIPNNIVLQVNRADIGL